MVSIPDLLTYITTHPVVMIVLAVAGIAFLISVIKKIIKAAIILFVILVLAGGIIFHAANSALKTQGERIIKDVREQFQGK